MRGTTQMSLSFGNSAYGEDAHRGKFDGRRGAGMSLETTSREAFVAFTSTFSLFSLSAFVWQNKR